MAGNTLEEYFVSLGIKGQNVVLKNIKDIKKQVQQMLLQEYKDSLIVRDFQKYLNRLIDVVLKKF